MPFNLFIESDEMENMGHPRTLGFISMAKVPVLSRGERRMNYKVITMKDRFFSGKFDPEKLESMLNSYAGEGWQLKAVTTAEIPGFGNKREEIIFILERP